MCHRLKRGRVGRRCCFGGRDNELGFGTGRDGSNSSTRGGRGPALLAQYLRLFAYSECLSNRLRDLCKFGCAGALIGLQRNCPGHQSSFSPQRPGLERLLSDEIPQTRWGFLNIIRTRAQGDFHKKKCTGPEARPPWTRASCGTVLSERQAGATAGGQKPQARG